MKGNYGDGNSLIDSSPLFPAGTLPALEVRIRIKDQSLEGRMRGESTLDLNSTDPALRGVVLRKSIATIGT